MLQDRAKGMAASIAIAHVNDFETLLFQTVLTLVHEVVRRLSDILPVSDEIHKTMNYTMSGVLAGNTALQLLATEMSQARYKDEAVYESRLSWLEHLGSNEGQ